MEDPVEVKISPPGGEFVVYWTCRCGYTGLPSDYQNHVHSPEPWPSVTVGAEGSILQGGTPEGTIRTTLSWVGR